MNDKMRLPLSCPIRLSLADQIRREVRLGSKLSAKAKKRLAGVADYVELLESCVSKAQRRDHGVTVEGDAA